MFLFNALLLLILVIVFACWLLLFVSVLDLLCCSYCSLVFPLLGLVVFVVAILFAFVACGLFDCLLLALFAGLFVFGLAVVVLSLASWLVLFLQFFVCLLVSCV